VVSGYLYQGKFLSLSFFLKRRTQTMKKFLSLLMVPVLGIALSLAAPTVMAQDKKETEEMKRKKKQKDDSDKYKGLPRPPLEPIPPPPPKKKPGS
jgi:hypothetical protein